MPSFVRRQCLRFLLYLILQSVLKRNQYGSGRFCFIFFASARFVRKVFWDGCGSGERGSALATRSCRTSVTSKAIANPRRPQAPERRSSAAGIAPPRRAGPPRSARRGLRIPRAAAARARGVGQRPAAPLRAGPCAPATPLVRAPPAHGARRSAPAARPPAAAPRGHAPRPRPELACRARAWPTPRALPAYGPRRRALAPSRPRARRAPWCDPPSARGRIAPWRCSPPLDAPCQQRTISTSVSAARRPTARGCAQRSIAPGEMLGMLLLGPGGRERRSAAQTAVGWRDSLRPPPKVSFNIFEIKYFQWDLSEGAARPRSGGATREANPRARGRPRGREPRLGAREGRGTRDGGDLRRRPRQAEASASEHSEHAAARGPPLAPRAQLIPRRRDDRGRALRRRRCGAAGGAARSRVLAPGRSRTRARVRRSSGVRARHRRCVGIHERLTLL